MSKTKPTYTEQLLERQSIALETIAACAMAFVEAELDGPAIGMVGLGDTASGPGNDVVEDKKTVIEKVVDAANTMTDEEWQGYDLGEAKSIIAQFISQNGPEAITATFESAGVQKLSELTDQQRDKICTKINGMTAEAWRKGAV